ncbi:TPM domain-containing protein, partial [Bdellovibrionota bacterium FG-1]
MMFAPAMASAGFEVPQIDSAVVDQVGVLDPTGETAVRRALDELRVNARVQMVVLIPKSLQGLVIEDYSIRVVEAYKLGRKREDRGLLLIIAPNERKTRLEVGYGLEGVLTDARSRHILDDSLKPFLQKGDYAGGISAAVRQITATLGGPASGAQLGAKRQEVRKDKNFRFWLGLLMSYWFPIFLLIGILRSLFGGGVGSQSRRRGGLGGWGGGNWPLSGGGFGGSSGGGDSFGG